MTRCQRFAVPTLAMTVLALGPWSPTRAEEIEVKIDSVQAGGTAFIVGDFIVGERAGTRLTCPCDGRIVAVRILWLSFFGTAPPTLENGIYIYGDNGNPNSPVPGPQLEFLEAPVMTPGFLNEFRYKDEEQTIPISVPVTEGQQFFVVLEFGEATDILGGSASVVRDLDGCQANRNILYAIPGGWQNFCNFIGGDLVIRAVVDCDEPTGACCRADGVCQENATQDQCLTYGAVWYPNQTCSQITCVPRGACCRLGGCLSLVPQTTCASIGGVYAGPGSDCAAGVCASGACCQGNGTCTTTILYTCATGGGTWQGAGTSCSPNPCPQPPGACCFSTFCIPGQPQPDCATAGGTWMGPLTSCTPVNPCEPPSGCPGDMNCDGVVDFDDIDHFVQALQGQANWPNPNCPWTNGDLSGDGNVTFDDIDPFVAAIGTTCP